MHQKDKKGKQANSVVYLQQIIGHLKTMFHISKIVDMLFETKFISGYWLPYNSYNKT